MIRAFLIFLDIRIEVNLKHGNEEAVRNLLGIISTFYNDSRKDEIQKLRGYFTKHLGQVSFTLMHL